MPPDGVTRAGPRAAAIIELIASSVRTSMGRAGPAGATVGPGAVATIVERIAVLVGAGVAPGTAWRLVGESVPGEATRASCGFVAAAAARGEPVSDAVLDAFASSTAASWRQLAAAWRVAEHSGAPLAGCLRSFVDALRADEEARRDIEVALSGPRATSRIVLALPPGGLLFSVAMGFDVGRVLVGTPVGWGCLVVATGLVAAARVWNRALVTRATPPDGIPGLRLELMAVALAGGGSWRGALEVVDAAIDDCIGGGTTSEPERQTCLVVLDLSRRAGAPAGLLLRSSADGARRDARAAGRSAAARLGSTLMVPLGVCVLPAFLVVGVVPLVVSLLSSTGIAL
ncbi:type II secretion system F family protein [Frigoribacterium sp. 2-23]|uniref:type II secretion system F family protein n=1 Tax=Frigoribacterium sp. 2-23 TaxID=3415006 RepID=UPI003C6F39B1